MPDSIFHISFLEQTNKVSVQDKQSENNQPAE